MTRDNKLVRFTIFVLLITIVAISLVSGTFAKYTTEKTGEATATVAKFSVDDNFSGDTESFDLFSTVKEANTTGTEEDVATGKIAPGTGGSFIVTVTNNSEVTVNATLTLEETSNTNNIPIEYSLNGEDFVTAANFTKTEKLTITGDTKEADITVYWRWAFTGAESDNFTTSQTDDSDTDLGELPTAPTIKVEATATFTQVD